jgi:replicative DNA helicase
MSAALATTTDERRDSRLRAFLTRLSPDERIALAGMMRASVDVGGRVPPHNEEAEAAVLSAILTDKRALEDVLDILPTGEPFYGDAHARIYDVAIELHAMGRPVDIQTVVDVLRQRDRLQAVGGVTYIATIIDATPSVAHVRAHAEIVREKWRVRQAAAACSMIAAEAFGDYGRANTFIEGAAEKLAAIAEDTVSTTVQTIEEIGRARDIEIRAQWEGERDPWGMRGPHASLHEMMHGFGLGEQTYVAADTGGGKSAYALQVALHLAGRTHGRETIACGYISLEMKSAKHYDRALIHIAHGLATEQHLRPPSMRELQSGREDVQVDGKWRSGSERLDAARVWCIEEAQRIVKRQPISFEDTPSDLAKIRATARRMQRTYRERGVRLRFLVIDHMHLMTFPNAQREDQAIATMVKGFNEIAKDLDLHLMPLAQFGRAANANEGAPRREHIRGSSAIEQIAHKILILYRPWLRLSYDAKARATREEAMLSEAILAKHRDGREGLVAMNFVGEAFGFVERDD